MRLGGLIVIAVACMSGAAAAGVPAPPSGTVSGDVIVAPTCGGPQRPDKSCSAPFVGTIVIRRAATGRLVAHVRSDARGRFSRRLAPGRYTLMPLRCGRVARNEAGSPPTVRITARRTTRTHLNCDTGLR